eukprot:784668-Pelagomonas_calceolata.AAC.2
MSVVTAENAGKLQCRVVVEAANAPVMPDGDQVGGKRRGGNAHSAEFWVKLLTHQLCLMGTR